MNATVTAEGCSYRCRRCLARVEASRRPTSCRWCSQVNTYALATDSDPAARSLPGPTAFFQKRKRKQESIDASGGCGETSSLDKVESAGEVRFEVGIGALDRLFGGGAVCGASYMLSGQPGAGKSTLLLQLLASVSKIYGENVFYATAEEQPKMIRDRGDRLKIPTKVQRKIKVSATDDIDYVCKEILRLRPVVVVLDSVQKFRDTGLPGMAGAGLQPGRVLDLFQQALISVQSFGLVISQENKRKEMAGALALQHHVDATFRMSVVAKSAYREITASKNRYGSADVVARLQMTETGLIESTLREDDSPDF